MFLCTYFQNSHETLKRYFTGNESLMMSFRFFDIFCFFNQQTNSIIVFHQIPHINQTAIFINQWKETLRMNISFCTYSTSNHPRSIEASMNQNVSKTIHDHKLQTMKKQSEDDRITSSTRKCNGT